MLHDPAVAKEFEEEFQRDKLAYEALSPRQQNLVDNIAKVEYNIRRTLISSTRAVIGVIEFAANLFLRLPYVMAARFAGFCANKLVQGLKLGVKGLTLGGRAVLGLCHGGLNLLERGIGYLEKKGLLSKTKGDAEDSKIENAKKKLTRWRDDIVHWGQHLVETIDKAWDKTKTALHKGVVKAAECAEYYGAIALYRGTKYILDPRRPDGKPLLGSERLNRTVGLAAAAVLFVGLSFQLSKLFVLGKIWHIKLAHSFVKDVAPLSHRLAKQITLQPLLAGGLASAKFVTLPIIAAARGALKSTRFTQGLSYRYNVRLREKQIAREARLNDTTPKTGLAAAARKVRRGTSALTRYLHKKTLNFVGVFIEHIVEKSSPEFYEARYKHYQDRKAGLTLPLPETTPAPVPDVAPAAAKPAVALLPALSPEFGRANDNDAAQQPAAPARAPNVVPSSPGNQ